MDILVNLIVWSLIIYRLATDFAEMDGPFDLYSQFRGYMIVKAGSHTWISDGVFCPICISFWLTTILCLVMLDYRYAAVAGVVRLIIDWRHSREQTNGYSE